MNKRQRLVVKVQPYRKFLNIPLTLFVREIRQEQDTDKRQAIAKDLKEYCQRDTLAMLKVREVLLEVELDNRWPIADSR